MASNPPTRLGDLERAVMEHLWVSTEAHPEGLTVRDVHDAIGVTRGLAYTTLMTVLDRMAKKQLVTRERDGRAWRYLPASSRDELTSEALHHTLGELAGSQRRSALLRFLDQSTPEELDELRAALADLEQREGTHQTG
ncbi:BlaI/MecI/CopY family transcriptional regulator [Intrasporangium calvum]|uniref:Transcriptional repressor, CopY family n=1 Tax=Intrasporangium calvum (strain ATCC 23552 / DSM 43043 / JCM 3097 / NBRC 12989 / NCIMB 10167 / NRRL B-3866 / 7 KIP) TaxID=710696 RepID=E6S634_INTC7|nr:BlaI/MecI/CopY family transcriptional regulator [Intrasporangium calvum]ADU46774.1 transcriptional repressor, CopY family [Intrasporangium calvum DSM 43043]AXG15137.1 BlaI/MecI/CopY family transcriptional regulator [Intrasporangium calvum]